MKHSEIGHIVKQPKGYNAFITLPFPPEAGFDFAPIILKKNDQAARLIGKLDGITRLLPDSDFFLLMYLRKDATSSSQIEGTRATMIDAIEAEANTNTNIPDDVQDILHYISALNYGVKRVKEDNFPLSLRFIRELHNVLMDKARASHFADPGEFRNSQNWIGGTNLENARFVPPPVDEMHKALDDLEKFFHSDDDTLTLIKAGLIHSQFETIHPFLDGNGRTGRMLITFYLWQQGFIEKPVLFLSSYFRRYQQVYYEKLNAYHTGEVNEWLEFFLDGVITIAQEAIDIAGIITELRERDRDKLSTLSARASESAILVLTQLYGQPIVNVATIQEWTGFTWSGAQRVIDRFVNLGILSPKDEDITYGQSYMYREYLDIFRDK
jgi:Fic family protein